MKIWRDTSEQDLDGEVWKASPLAPNYEVSSLGRVRVMINQFNKNGRHFWVGKIITQNQTSKSRKYLRVSATVDGEHVPFGAHRLVATAFLPNPNNLPQVNHIDGNPENNRVENLEWVTAKENVEHAERTGLRWYPEGEASSSHKLTKENVLQILGMRYNLCMQSEDIASFFPFLHHNYIPLIYQGKRWKKVFKEWMENNSEFYFNLSYNK